MKFPLGEIKSGGNWVLFVDWLSFWWGGGMYMLVEQKLPWPEAMA